MNLQTLANDNRSSLETIPSAQLEASFANAVLAGLKHDPKKLSPMYFYDERGSRLFEAICALPEYYLSRTEQEILDDSVPQMVGHFQKRLVLIELGSGNSAKTRTIIDALFSAGHSIEYRPVDISMTMLDETVRRLSREYPALPIRAVACDYQRGLEHVSLESSRQKVYLFLGSNLGNFNSHEAARFLRTVRNAMAPGDYLLIGVDLIKPLPILKAAYDDSEGVTAAFNRNLLRRINRELRANFNLDRFEHLIRWNEREAAVEMHLRSAIDQAVYIGQLDLMLEFQAGETIHTESSHKYTLESFVDLCGQADLVCLKRWRDRKQWFAVHLVAPAARSIQGNGGNGQQDSL